MSEHATTITASGFERLMLCPGSVVLNRNAPRTTSQYSAEGTLIHSASAAVLQGADWPAFGSAHEVEKFTFTWDADMLACGQAYVDYVTGLYGDFVDVEQRVRFGPAIGVDNPEDGFGTADAVVGKGDELIVVDLKCGRGVEVTAGTDIRPSPEFKDPYVPAPNPQLALYAIGALEARQGLVGDYTAVRLVIVQPRAGGVSEYVMTVEELAHWAKTTATATVDRVVDAILADDLGPYLSPTEKGCKFCAAKATCPALRDEVAQNVMGNTPAKPDEFDCVTEPVKLMNALHDDPAQWLSACLSKVDLIEDWCKAVRAEAERRLVAGDDVPGYKLVQGKRGARQWADAALVEEVLKSYRLKVEEMYDLKLISPTSAEKLHKAKTIGPRQWPKLQQYITQPEGKPHVAPSSDPRPAITVAVSADDFALA